MSNISYNSNCGKYYKEQRNNGQHTRDRISYHSNILVWSEYRSFSMTEYIIYSHNHPKYFTNKLHNTKKQLKTRRFSLPKTKGGVG